MELPKRCGCILSRMVKIRVALIVFAWLALNIGGTAFAQTTVTVGEILDKGGKKLSKDEVTELLTGATMKGIQTARPQNKFELSLKPDGSVSGSAIDWATQTNYVSVSGQWSINENGQYCTDLRNSFGSKPAGTGNCNYVFAVDGSHYIAISEGRGTQAYQRDITR